MTFSFGAVWGRFFKLISENIATFLILVVLLVLVPQLIWQVGMFEAFNITRINWVQHIATLGPEGVGGGIGGGVIVWLLNLVSLCAITEVAILRAVGKPVKLGEVLGHAVGNMIPVFVISLLVGILVGFGLVLFIVPGVMFGLAACVAIPAYVGEKGRGIWGSVQRSFELTKGHRWMLLLIFFVAFIATWIVEALLEAPLMRATFTAAMAGAQPVMSLTSLLTMVAATALLTLFWHVFVAAIYVSLRESKDKLSPDQTASVF